MNFEKLLRAVSFQAMVAAAALPGICYAIVGENIETPNESEYPSICKIVVTNSREMREDLCTGILDEGGEILTAGHCFGRNFDLMESQVEASCGGEKMGRVKKVTLLAGNADSDWLDERNPISRLDRAVAKLAKPSNEAIQSKAESRNSYFTSDGELRAGVQCSVLGYGIDNDGNKGTLHSGDLTGLHLWFEPKDGLIHLTAKSGGNLRVSVDRGDSGGPLLCGQPGQEPEWVGTTVLVRVSPSSREERIENIFLPVW